MELWETVGNTPMSISCRCQVGPVKKKLCVLAVWCFFSKSICFLVQDICIGKRRHDHHDCALPCFVSCLSFVEGCCKVSSSPRVSKDGSNPDARTALQMQMLEAP